jgi:biopolymer transport protein ExbB
MVAIAALGALCVAVVIERAWMLWRWRVDEAALLAELRSGALDAARARAAAHPAGRLLGAGAESDGDEAVWDAISAEATLVEQGVRARVGYLAAAGNLSTMLGLLGTVYGLILAFSGLADTASTERAALLSDGIAAAMNTTAFGLLVGIPALGAHALLEAACGKVLATAEAAAALRMAARRGRR